MDYSQLSDFEINCKVAFHIGLKTVERAEDGEFKPCANPADAWPIIFENKIMLSPHCADDEWKAQIHLGRDDIFDNYASAWHKNPLRAAMIVFLMMQGSKDA